jgi:hypothetical protein
MIDLRVDQPHDEHFVCECGDPERLGPAEAVIPVVEAPVATLPQLESPMLKLIKERNEARKMCEVLAGSFPDIATLTNDKAITAANEEMHQALWAYCKAKKHWDKRSYQLGGEQ